MNIEQTLRILMGAFLVQGLLAIVTWWPRGGGPVEARDLVEADGADLASITITGTVQRGETPDEPIVLKRQGEGWVLASKFNLEVPETQIDKLEVRRPIVENAYRHADLDVAADQHSRKLVLESSGGDVTTLYVGSAGSAAHVRIDGENEVYRVRGVTAYSVSSAPTSYYDTQVLDVASGTVDEVSVRREDGGTFTFTKTDLGWSVDVAGPAGRTLNPTKASQFVDELLSITMTEPAGAQATPDMGLDAGTEVTWTATEEGATVTGRYVVSTQIEGSGRHYVQVEGKPFVYEVLASQVENARTKPLNSLFDQ